MSVLIANKFMLQATNLISFGRSIRFVGSVSVLPNLGKALFGVSADGKLTRDFFYCR